MAEVGHLVRHDQVVFGVDRGLHIVADHARAPTACRHGAGVGIGQRDLLVRRGLNLLLRLFQGLHLPAQAGDLLGDPLGPGFGDVAVLAVGPVEGGQVARDAGIDLFHALGDLGHGEVLVAVVDRLELAAVDRHHGLGEQIQPAAKLDELATYRPDRRAVVAAEVGDGLEVRRQASGQPHQLDIALRFPLQSPA
jgi:hypothetical protein